jgi:serine/threonine-protein kinase
VRRRARHFGIAGLAIAVGILLRVVQVASRPPLCRGAREQLAGVWDGTRATSIQKAFAGVGRTYAGDTFVKVRAMLDAYAREWADTYTEACEATNIRGEQSAEVLDLRMTCLKQERGELKAITDLFSSADGDVLARAVNAVSSLRSVAQCGDVSVLRAVVRLPDDRATRERVESLRPRLAEVKALFEAGHYRASIALAKPLVDEARQVAYDPVLAEALYMLGHSQWLGADFTGGEASLEEAMVRAEASRHDRVLAEAAVDMTSLLMRADRFEDLDRFSARARATVARLGGDLRLESWIDTSLASAMSAQGRAAQALEWNQRALEAKQRAFGPDHWDVAISLANVADDLRDLGRDAEAFATNERALRILEASLGTQHPMVAAVLANQCDARVALGEPARGRADCEHVLSIWKTEPPEREEFFGYPLTSIGLSFLAENRPVEAIAPLEEALRVRASDRARPELRADTAFALARARWSSGRDRSRAMKLAEEARDLYGAKKEAERKKVEAAMAEWRRGL